jgi:CubicO group peptidase (beta-lactamase class C family)
MPFDELIAFAKPADLGFDPDRLARLGPWLRGYVDDGKLPFASLAVMRKGEIAYVDTYGMRDIEAGTPAISDGLSRIYSMSKLITTVAAMSLYEEGRFMLDDPISAFLPEFAAQKVYISGPYDDMELVEPDSPVTVRQLMNHTSGLTYGIFDPGPVGRAMRRAKADFSSADETLADVTARLGDVPLCFQPGTRWNYGVSTDVLGRLVEVVAGKPFEEVLRERIFEPLGMSDTFFGVPDKKVDRFCALYTKTDDAPLKLIETAAESRFRAPTSMASGGGGLVSSMADYLRFVEMVRRGGVLGGARILGRKTVDLMILNHLPGDMASMGQATFSEMPMHGIGFGLGGAVLLDPAKAQILGSPGEFTWGGMASTAFWIDQAEEISVVFMTQLIPSSSYPIRRELRVLVYQALVD